MATPGDRFTDNSAPSDECPCKPDIAQVVPAHAATLSMLIIHRVIASTRLRLEIAELAPFDPAQPSCFESYECPLTFLRTV